MGCAHGAASRRVGGDRCGGRGAAAALVLRDLGDHRFKDLSEPQRLFQLCGSGLREGFPPLKSLGGYFTNLPTQPSPLLGREAGVRRVRRICSAAHPARDADRPGRDREDPPRAAGRRLKRSTTSPAACSSATSHPLRDPDLVASTIAHAIGVHEQPGETSEQAVAELRRRTSICSSCSTTSSNCSMPRRSWRGCSARCPNLHVLVDEPRASARLRRARVSRRIARRSPDAVALFGAARLPARPGRRRLHAARAYDGGGDLRAARTAAARARAGGGAPALAQPRGAARAARAAARVADRWIA